MCRSCALLCEECGNYVFISEAGYEAAQYFDRSRRDLHLQIDLHITRKVALCPNAHYQVRAQQRRSDIREPFLNKDHRDAVLVF